MGKLWSVLFLLITVGGVACFAVAPYINHSLPRDVSEHGWAIDHLYFFILWLTGMYSSRPKVVMFWFMWKYRRGRQPATGEVHSRQPHAGDCVDDYSGGYAVVYRALSNECLGRGEDAAP